MEKEKPTELVKYMRQSRFRRKTLWRMKVVVGWLWTKKKLEEKQEQIEEKVGPLLWVRDEHSAFNRQAEVAKTEKPWKDWGLDALQGL